MRSINKDVKECVILSAELPGLSENENIVRTNELRARLEDLGLPFSPANGIYKGERERSFVVIVNNMEDVYKLACMAFDDFNQESYLYKDDKRYCELVFNDDARQSLGYMEAVSEYEAKGHEAYTFTNGRFFICKGE